ncbi:hypothetical protein BgiBS90_032785 [Biomphalaria glabrata]|nr:hypothetical protein BgiBS90_032785 [Biomphalaria glabrata]
MGHEELKDIGVTAYGPRFRILKGLSKLNSKEKMNKELEDKRIKVAVPNSDVTDHSSHDPSEKTDICIKKHLVPSLSTLPMCHCPLCPCVTIHSAHASLSTLPMCHCPLCPCVTVHSAHASLSTLP